MKAGDITRKATVLVDGDRDRQHGDKLENFQNIADLWSAYRGAAFTAHDVALMMILMKVARTKSGSHNLDDYIDAAGYAGCAGEIAEGQQPQPTKFDPVQAFRNACDVPTSVVLDQLSGDTVVRGGPDGAVLARFDQLGKIVEDSKRPIEAFMQQYRKDHPGESIYVRTVVDGTQVVGKVGVLFTEKN